jgi:hypothetical protein
VCTHYIRSWSSWRWYINKIIDFLRFIHLLVFIFFPQMVFILLYFVHISCLALCWAHLRRFFTWGWKQTSVCETLFYTQTGQWVLSKTSIVAGIFLLNLHVMLYTPASCCLLLSSEYSFQLLLSFSFCVLTTLRKTTLVPIKNKK